MELISFIIAIAATLGVTAFLLKQKDFLKIFATGSYMFFVFFVFAINSDPTITYPVSAFSSGSPTTTSAVYNVTTFTGTVSIFSPNPTIYAESAASSSSQLQNKNINCFGTYLSKVGSPPINTIIQTGVYDASGNLKYQFGTLNVTMLSTGAQWYEFCGTSTYTIVTGDRIGVKYAGGNSTNAIKVQGDTNNPYDSTVTIANLFNSGTNSWSTSSSLDLTYLLAFRSVGSNGSWNNGTIPMTISPTTLTIINTLTLMGAFIIILFGYRGIVKTVDEAKKRRKGFST